MAGVTQLGYWGFEVSDLAAWEAFATDVLGLAVAARQDDGGLRLRLDEHSWRIALEPGPADDLAYVGWEVKDERALGELGEQLARGGAHVEEGKPELCALRQVQGLLHCADPAGIPTELYWGPQIAKTPFCSPRVASGFVAGEQGAGHMVVSSPDAEATLAFYTQLLGLRVSDYIDAEIGPIQLHLTFLHANARHHSVAFSGLPLPKRIHHFMIETRSFDEVGAAHDRALDAGVPIKMGLGRHQNDKMFSFYSETPSGFDVEFGWGGLAVDDETWRVVTYSQLSEWGHRPGGA
jgi:2,3-dihydroxybiphenyl 1,2-dioxygenase